MPRKILFIINPNAGKKIPDRIIASIRQTFPANIYYQIVVWKDPAHFAEIAAQLRDNNYSDAVAVGGDGTVNQVAAAIAGTAITLGIVPVGSGNGLARTLGLSMVPEESIRQIAEGRRAKIDHGLVNGMPFFCTSGVGFDAHIGSLFAKSTERGLKSYVRITMREIWKYSPQTYVIRIGDRVLERKAFLITVANSGQYGNNFYIAPEASMHDGLFHVAVLRPFSFFRVLPIFWKIFRRRAHKSAFIETFSCDGLTISRDHEGAMHFDGEPATAGREIVFEMRAANLHAIVGPGYAYTE